MTARSSAARQRLDHGRHGRRQHLRRNRRQHDLSAGTGNTTISGGGGNDTLTGGGLDSWLMFYGSTNMTLTDTTFSTSGGGLAPSVSTISGFQNAILAAGTGDFTLDASAFSGSAILRGNG